MNPRLADITTPPTIRIADAVRRMRREGRDVIALQTGDPWQATHPEVAAAMADAVARGLTHYTTSRGTPELRSAISADVAARRGAVIDPETEVLVTAGAAQALFLALTVLVTPGDRVVLFEPYYPQYEQTLRLLGAEPVGVPPLADMTPDLDAFERVAEDARGVIVNSPNNPSGAVYPESVMAAVASACAERGMWCVTDEVYASFVAPSAPYASLLPSGTLPDRLVYVDSFSKRFAMTGWRLGYAVAPRDVADAMLKVLQLSTTCVPEFVQRAGVAALGSSAVAAHSAAMASSFDVVRDEVFRRVSATAIAGPRPSGAFYQLLNVGGDATAWSERLLKEKAVAVAPADAYGSSMAGWVRLSSSGPPAEVLEGVDRIVEFAEMSR